MGMTTISRCNAHIALDQVAQWFNYAHQGAAEYSQAVAWLTTVREHLDPRLAGERLALYKLLNELYSMHTAGLRVATVL